MSIERILLIDEVDEDNTVVVMSIFPDFKKFAGPTWKDEIWSTNCLLIKYQRESPQGLATQVCSHRKVSMLLHSVTWARVAEVVRRYEGPSAQSLDSDESFKPWRTLFLPILRFVAIYAFFGNLWAKKVFFWSKTVFFGQEVH